MPVKINTSLLNIVLSEVERVWEDDPGNLATGEFCHIGGVISPVHDVLLPSGKKLCVFSDECCGYRARVKLANLTFKDSEQTKSSEENNSNHSKISKTT